MHPCRIHAILSGRRAIPQDRDGVNEQGARGRPRRKPALGRLLRSAAYVAWGTRQESLLEIRVAEIRNGTRDAASCSVRESSDALVQKVSPPATAAAES